MSVADQIEHRKPFVVADDDFTVDQTGSHRKRCYGGDCKGEAIPEVISVARDQVDLSSVFAREDAEPVMLDLVNPVWTGWRLFCRSGKAGLEGKFTPVETAPELTEHRHVGV